MSMKLPILMTASVSTRGMKGADFSDEAREKMYLETLAYYLREFPGRPIVFVENSGWDLRAFRGKVAADREGLSRVEFISLDPDDFDISKGKGYNESLMLTKAICQSAAIRAVGAFMKVTGRYPIFNLGYFLERGEHYLFDLGYHYYGDIKDHKVFDFLFPHNTKKWNGHAAYTVLFATTVDFYNEKLGPCYVDCYDYDYNFVENVWFKVLKPYRGMKGARVQLRFRREPICGGLQGSTAQTIGFSKSNQSVKARVARFVGNCIRWFMPWFWF